MKGWFIILQKDFFFGKYTGTSPGKKNDVEIFVFAFVKIVDGG